MTHLAGTGNVPLQGVYTDRYKVSTLARYRVSILARYRVSTLARYRVLK
jgi:hypothetical protein